MPEFRKVFNIQGFDRWQNPRWQMVPEGGERYVALREGAGLEVTVDDPALATVTEITSHDLPSGNRAPLMGSDRLFKIEGRNWGLAYLEARREGAVELDLELDIKKKKTVSVTFNFVRDGAGHKTRRTMASVTQWLREINAIYEPQTNITIRQKDLRWVTIPQDLGQVIRFARHLPGIPAAQHEWAEVTRHGDPKADLNIFFVWEYEQDNSPFSDQTDAGTLANNCIFEDRAGGKVGETLAHEIGHYLGCDDHYEASLWYHLMYGITDARGIHIPREDANMMNL